MTHPLHLLKAVTSLGLRRAVQYRTDFLLEGAATLLVLSLQLIPVEVLFGQRQEIAGWSHGSMLVLLGWYMVMRSILDGIITPSLAQTIAGIRTGNFDYVLLKPVDPMVLSSVSHIRPWQILHTLAGLGIAGRGLLVLDQIPTAGAMLAAVLMSVAALLTVYALFILCVAGSFVVVRIQNIMNVLASLLDFARWPAQVFEGLWRLVFTFVLPVAVISTYPAMALLGQLTAQQALTSLAVASGFLSLARWAWQRSLARYRSASS
ncbi:ABC-2 family transporter protein [Mitsuaria sp. WAJ17]|uniref:ABC transporter permease n=1 Tax=Mitsuaria sp. WAJ17 TaxID=2761452 RepID=UPI0016034510|nr:ABC-2 family transporter protein [Mitsuaria sp. WAJ17]MBB2485171.1 ABC-2 family transporter protein [Mitsuaria sp. WAJ17]